jgi:hypothetical protein
VYPSVAGNANTRLALPHRVVLFGYLAWELYRRVCTWLDNRRAEERKALVPLPGPADGAAGQQLLPPGSSGSGALVRHRGLQQAAASNRMVSDRTGMVLHKLAQGARPGRGTPAWAAQTLLPQAVDNAVRCAARSCCTAACAACCTGASGQAQGSLNRWLDNSRAPVWCRTSWPRVGAWLPQAMPHFHAAQCGAMRCGAVQAVGIVPYEALVKVGAAEGHGQRRAV